MNKNDFSNDVQNFIKSDPDTIKKLANNNIGLEQIDDLLISSRENIDAIITQNIGDVETCADMIVKSLINNMDSENGDHVEQGSVGMGVLNSERKVLNFNDFVNENKKGLLVGKKDDFEVYFDATKQEYNVYKKDKFFIKKDRKVDIKSYLE